MNRSTARKHAFILVYQLPFHSEPDCSEIIEDYFEQLDEDINYNQADKAFITGEFLGVHEHIADIDGYLSEYCEGWTLDRLSKVDLAIMRLSAYEMLYAGDIPVSVSINEAVSLAKVFGADDSSSFVNGVLGKIATTISSG